LPGVRQQSIHLIFLYMRYYSLSIECLYEPIHHVWMSSLQINQVQQYPCNGPARSQFCRWHFICITLLYMTFSKLKISSRKKNFILMQYKHLVKTGQLSKVNEVYHFGWIVFTRYFPCLRYIYIWNYLNYLDLRLH
jgi:hypothetical protein